MMTGFGMGFGWLGMIVMVVVLVTIVGGGLWIVGNISPVARNLTPRSTQPESGLDILKRRYANGEISRDEYEEMHRVLET